MKAGWFAPPDLADLEKFKQQYQANVGVAVDEAFKVWLVSWPREMLPPGNHLELRSDFPGATFGYFPGATFCGATFHLQGYPPWQLHAAELFHEESLDRFSRRDLARVIDKYAKTAQRFGK